MQTLATLAARLAFVQLVVALLVAGLLLAHAALSRRSEAGWTRS